MAVRQTPNEAANRRLLESAAIGNAAEARAAIEAGANVNAASDARVTALGVAALHGHTPVVAALLAAGADLAADHSGQTALMLARSVPHGCRQDARRGRRRCGG